MTTPTGSNVPSDVTSDDKLWALLAYVLSPLIPAIIMFAMPEKKDRPFIKAHNAQALVVGLVEIVLGIVLSWTICVPFILWGVLIYWGIQAYNGKLVTIPVVTDFVKNQGWA